MRNRIDAGLAALREKPADPAIWLGCVALIVYLSLKAGGYDPIPRNQVGILVWWVLLVGVAAGAFSIKRIGYPARTVGVLFLALVAWTALALGWTQSAERTATELARVVTYLGVFALALAVQGGRRWRALLYGVTTGIAIVAGLAVLSRLHPQWFPPNELGRVLPDIEIERRLAYPLNYSSALGAFAAMALPLLLAVSSLARTYAGQLLAAAAFPVAGLAFYLSSSGTATVVVVAGLVFFVLIAPDRLPKLATLAVGAAGTAILGYAVDQRAALDRGLPTDELKSQGSEVLVILIVVCLAVALCQLGISMAVRHGRRPRWLLIPPRVAAVGVAVGIVIAAPIAAAAGAPGELKDRWENFKSRTGAPTTASRSSQILNTSGSGRYQFWESAVDAYKTEQFHGIGPGTFEFWWSQHGSYTGFVRDAHSLYVEALAELGIIGFLLTTGLVLAIVGVGTVRSLRAPPDLRLGLAAAAAGCVAFAVAAGVDYMWEIAVMPICFFLLSAVLVDAARGAVPMGRTPKDRRRREIGWWAGTVLASIIALVVIYLPYKGATDLRASEQDVSQGKLDSALSEAESSADAQPYAASPRLQEALVLERQGKFDEAAAAAKEATEKESTNWRTFFVLSRVEAERGRARASLAAYRRARQLNPRSGVFPQ
ncbi:MAG TPA: O-antigen ligase family protein [Solirubrobacterales bacterium]|nr:O-antigen ligase family protein [Solirubrobacterales bacterium]